MKKFTTVTEFYPNFWIEINTLVQAWGKPFMSSWMLDL